MEEHPTIEDFARLLQQSARPSQADRNALVVRHLLAGCAVCHHTLRETEGIPGLLERLLEIGLRAETETSRIYSYEWTFAKAERTIASILARGMPSERLPKLLSELADLPEGEQVLLVSREARFADPELIRELIERSHEARYRNPRKMLHTARLARLASEALAPEKAGGGRQLADLRARALGQYGTALRLIGRPFEAESALTAAECHRQSGSGDPVLHAWLTIRYVSLAIFQGRFADAVAMADKAAATCEQTGERILFASLRVQKAIAQLYGGDAEEAVITLNQALPSINSQEDPYLLLAAHHNLARCYIDLDQPEEALALYVDARELYRKCKDPLILLRATWQEGLLLREIGHLHNAEVALVRARKGYVEQGFAYETALVALDLADVYVKLGDQESVQRVVSEALPIFRSLRVGRESLASLLQLKRAEESPEIP